MDWIEILLLLLFFVFPVLQQLLAGRKETPPLPPPGERDEPELEPAPERTMEPERAQAPAGEGWSTGWGDWPTAPEELAGEGVMEEEEALALSELQRVMEPEVVPEAVRVSAPVYSLESLHVDRAREHQRFHARVESGLPRRAPRRPRLATMIRGRGDLRRAVVLAEVLGRPKGLDG